MAGVQVSWAYRIKTGLTADCTVLDINDESGNVAWTRPAFVGNLMATIIFQIGTVCPSVFKKTTLVAKATIIREEFHVPLSKSAPSFWRSSGRRSMRRWT